MSAPGIIAHGENVMAVDDVRPALALLHARRLRIDPLFPGECRQLSGNPGVRLNYFGRNGMTLDEAGEALWDAGITVRRLDIVELLALLEMLFTPRPRARKGRKRGRKIVDAAERKARGMRNRHYQCPACKQNARGTRNSSLICGICYEMAGEIVFLARVDPLPEEILEQAAAATECAA